MVVTNKGKVVSMVGRLLRNHVWLCRLLWRNRWRIVSAVVREVRMVLWEEEMFEAMMREVLSTSGRVREDEVVQGKVGRA